MNTPQSVPHVEPSPASILEPPLTLPTSQMLVVGEAIHLLNHMLINPIHKGCDHMPGYHYLTHHHSTGDSDIHTLPSKNGAIHGNIVGILVLAYARVKKLPLSISELRCDMIPLWREVWELFGGDILIPIQAAYYGYDFMSVTIDDDGLVIGGTLSVDPAWLTYKDFAFLIFCNIAAYQHRAFVHGSLMFRGKSEV